MSWFYSGWIRVCLVSLLAAGLVGCSAEGDEATGNIAHQPYETPVVAELDLFAPVSDSESRAHPELDFGADTRSVEERLQDATLATQVRQALAARRTLGRYDFDVEAREGIVILRGHVERNAERHLAEQVAEGMEGVEELVSMLSSAEPSRTATADRSSAHVGGAHHVVQPGESLWHIARSHNVRVDHIKELNGITSNSIRPGDRLRVR